MSEKDQYQMQDPNKQYPQLDIPKQRQDEPGLDAKLQPKADHGQDTYRGCDRLKGRKALITGGDSGIGWAAYTTGKNKSEILHELILREINKKED